MDPVKKKLAHAERRIVLLKRKLQAKAELLQVAETAVESYRVETGRLVALCEAALRPERRKLPNRRQSTSSTLRFSGVVVDCQVGYYADGRIGEVFMTTRKAGTIIDVMCRDTALLVSIALQYGATLDELARTASLNDDGAPDGLVSVLAQHLKTLEIAP